MNDGGGGGILPAEAEADAPHALLSVSLPAFTGPLDLLLHLIRKNSLSIYDIPIATLCDQYHETLREMQELDLEIASEFLTMASWLVYIKSRMLLPRPEETEDGDPREELVERLLEYRRVKAVADLFHDDDVVRRLMWRPVLRAPEGVGDDRTIELEAVDLGVLARTYLEIMERHAAENPPPLTVLPLRHTVEQKMRDLYRKVREERLVRLLSHLHTLGDVEEIVTLVVATLELVRLGGIRAEQRVHFAEIYLRPGREGFDLEGRLEANVGS